MRIIITFIISLFFLLQTYGADYRHADGSKIHTEIPAELNQNIRKIVEEKIQNLLPKLTPPTIEDQLYKDIAISVPTGASDPVNWEHDIEVKIIYQDANITSLLINSYEYTGGAHGSMSRNGIVIDNTTGKIILLDELYDTNKLVQKLAPIWKNKIINALEKNTESTLGNDEIKWIEEGTQTIDQYSSFVITPKWLIVYGQQYQHNAYAYGMQTLYYPRSKLTDIAK